LKEQPNPKFTTISPKKSIKSKTELLQIFSTETIFALGLNKKPFKLIKCEKVNLKYFAFFLKRLIAGKDIVLNNKSFII
jgi:hypothetical protein